MILVTAVEVAFPGQLALLLMEEQEIPRLISVKDDV